MCQCQSNEKPGENIECKCKQICCKMQNDGLRIAINGLKNHQKNSNSILETLSAIYNLLNVYSCIPGTCLLKRVQWVKENVHGRYASLCDHEIIKVNMLIAELEAFLDS